MSEVRLLPLVIASASALLLLKAVALTMGDGRIAISTALAEDEQALEEGGPAGIPAAEMGRGSRDEILKSLSERRDALDAREKELDLRERLLEATRANVEERIAALREIEGRLEAAVDARHAEHSERLASLVTMYETMKPRDAAKIFNRLDIAILVNVASSMNARRMAEILAAMDPAVAQKLTVELSAEPADPLDELDTGEDLPKIIGTRQES